MEISAGVALSPTTAAVLGTASLLCLLPLFALASFSFGYSIAVGFFVVIIGFVWFSYFSSSGYDRIVTRWSIVASLLAFLIPLTGRIGAVPAFIALALYALLPIVRNTHAGLTQIPAGLQDAARAFALPASLVLRKIELPLAAPTIYAGIKTSAVINVGTATIAAFVGAGGFGERIVTGGDGFLRACRQRRKLGLDFGELRFRLRFV